MAIPSDKVRPFVGVAALMSLTAPTHSQDRPQWRGPERDGVANGVRVPAKWPKALKEEWKSEVGDGVSSPVVAGGRVYVFARQKDDEVVLCFDLACPAARAGHSLAWMPAAESPSGRASAERAPRRS
jgi:hypothetical protein